MFYNVILIDPRPAQKEAMAFELEKNAPVVGIEFTLPALEQYLVSNIDDQHVPGASNRAACEVALEMELPAPNTTLAIVRPDVDALLAVAILNERLSGEHSMSSPLSDEARGRVATIAKNDKFANGDWPGPRPLVLQEDQTGFEGLGIIAMNFKLPIQERVGRMQQWLVSGDCEGLEAARQQAVDMFNQSAKSSKVGFLHDDPDSGVALVQSSHMKATGVGYHYAPVVIIRNPEFRFAGGDPHTKYTVCAWSVGCVDFDGLKKALNELENGWGGSATIVGSPQGISSSLSMEQVANLVALHLKLNTRYNISF